MDIAICFFIFLFKYLFHSFYFGHQHSNIDPCHSFCRLMQQTKWLFLPSVFLPQFFSDSGHVLIFHSIRGQWKEYRPCMQMDLDQNFCSIYTPKTVPWPDNLCFLSFKRVMMGIPLYVICCFSLAAFNIFSLYLIFVSSVYMCLSMFLLGFILYGTLVLPGLG